MVFAHLKVSAKTLGIKFSIPTSRDLFLQSNHVHVSGNNSLKDLNNSIRIDLKIKKSNQNFKRSKYIYFRSLRHN